MVFSHDSREFPSTPAFASAAAPSRWAQGRRNRRSPKGPQWGSGHPSRLAFCLRRNCDFVMANQQFRNQWFLIDVGPVLSSLSVQIFWIVLIYASLRKNIYHWKDQFRMAPYTAMDHLSLRPPRIVGVASPVIGVLSWYETLWLLAWAVGTIIPHGLGRNIE